MNDKSFVNKLKARSIQLKKAKYPNVPEHAIPALKIVVSNTNGLTKACVEVIDLTGGWATRVNVMGRDIQTHNGTKKIPSTTKRGTPDILGFGPDGRGIGLEIKFGKDRLSKEQKQVRDFILKSGGLWLEVKAFSHFCTWYESTFNLEI